MSGIFRRAPFFPALLRRAFPWTKTAAGANKAITPDPINATSSVTASVRKLAAVVPATINATSNVTATRPAVLRAVIPGTINATSSISSTVTKLAAVKPASISATSTVTASRPIVLRAIKPASINSTSTVTASMIFQRNFPATINATSFMFATISGIGGGFSNLTMVDPNVPQHVFMGAR